MKRILFYLLVIGLLLSPSVTESAMDTSFSLTPVPAKTGADAKTLILPRIYLQGTGVLTNGTTTTKTDYIDASPAGEWAGIDGDVTNSTDTDYFKQGANSLKVMHALASAAGDTTLHTLGGGDENWSSRESLGVWIYTDVALSAGDFDFRIYDATGNSDIDIPAVTVNVWTWVEIDISGVADANKDVITDIAFVMTVDKGAINLYFDFLAKWDAADETRLTKDLIQDGMLSAIANPVAAATAMAWVQQTEYTDFFINYGSGAADDVVMMTDESLNCFIMNYAYQD